MKKIDDNQFSDKVAFRDPYLNEQYEQEMILARGNLCRTEGGCEFCWEDALVMNAQFDYENQLRNQIAAHSGETSPQMKCYDGILHRLALAQNSAMVMEANLKILIRQLKH